MNQPVTFSPVEDSMAGQNSYEATICCQVGPDAKIVRVVARIVSLVIRILNKWFSVLHRKVWKAVWNFFEKLCNIVFVF